MNAPLPVVADNHWNEFYQTLKERLCVPARHPTFVLYFIGIIVVIGGFGIFEPLVSFVLGKTTKTELPHALICATYTYFVAIAATAAVDLTLSYRKRKYLLMLFLLSCFLVLFLAFLSAIINRHQYAAIPTVIGYILALVLWWIGNATNANLLDTPPPENAPTGGSSSAPPVGDLAGFNS